jgi:hypothetical protein
MPPIRQDDILLRLIKTVGEIQSALRRVTVNLPLYDINNENTPATLTENQNDYVIGDYDVLRLQGIQQITITGLKRGVKGRKLRIFNVGGDEIVLAHQSSLSTAEYRIVSPTGRDAVINANGEALLYYDATTERWRVGYNSNADRISVKLGLSGAQSIPDATYTQVSWTSIVLDTGFFFDATTPTFVTIPETGWYQITLHIAWDINGTNLRETLIEKALSVPFGNISFDSRLAVTGASTNVELAPREYLERGDTLFVTLWQNSGGALNINVNGPRGSTTSLVVAKAS